MRGGEQSRKYHECKDFNYLGYWLLDLRKIEWVLMENCVFVPLSGKTNSESDSTGTTHISPPL